MSIDRMQSVPGRFSITPEPTSGAFPGAMNIGGNVEFLEGLAANTGGALTLVPKERSAATAVATSGTITHNNCGIVIVSAAAAVTGVILQAGSKHGQMLTVVHTGAAANTITFAAAGTSNVAQGGTSPVITGPEAAVFVWNAIDARWYSVGTV